MLEVLAYTLLGVGLGTFTGLIPGVHVNNLAPLLVGVAAVSGLPPMNIVAAIVAMMMSHTIISYVSKKRYVFIERDSRVNRRKHGDNRTKARKLA
ncbi:hypothetical protein ES703_01595 [subsurface metagenome]